MLDEAYDLVKYFQLQAGQPVSDIPEFLSPERVAIRHMWMKDELEEFLDAQNLYEQVDAIMDLLYYAIGTLVELGVKPDKLFAMLHEWNMKKLIDICYDEKGKVLKPEGWKHPDEQIKQIVDQMKTQ
ncbi:MAG: HAD family hydrolase [Clostridia bacterium]|nr:HAD family hydrolase [Clostridia bacterium]